jgi:hypothetical protein
VVDVLEGVMVGFGVRRLGEVVDAVAVLVAIFGVPGIGVLGY